ncbi:hypothetical protein [Pseudobutyrivibrio sp. YE44]|uniref:hypothetical protein n=1 Tax=Pseudobutyrivibrio sp. YE44 TaxID=1520802 RepID=UPI00115FFA1C|nr:hypothetical protein [Pseudobutyrivibrio sp. YE44]
MSKKYNDIMDQVTLSDEAKSRILENIRNYDNSENKDNKIEESPKVVKFTNWRKYTAVAAAAAVVVVAGSAIHMQSNIKSDTAMMESATEVAGSTETYEASEEALEDGATTPDAVTEGEADEGYPDYDVPLESAKSASGKRNLLDNIFDKKTEKSESTTIANPLVEYDSAKELSDAAGFTIKDLNTKKFPFKITSTSYILIGGTTAEIIYYGEDDKAICYRKAAGHNDISGDYNTYEYEKQEFNGNGSITLKGNEENKYSLALWEDANYSYSLSMEPAQTMGSITLMLNQK